VKVNDSKLQALYYRCSSNETRQESVAQRFSDAEELYYSTQQRQFVLLGIELGTFTHFTIL
jgi:hypothetical protein